MAKKISMSVHAGRTIQEVFDDFVVSQTARGLSDVTIKNYRHHLHSMSKHLDIQKPIDELRNLDRTGAVAELEKHHYESKAYSQN